MGYKGDYARNQYGAPALDITLADCHHPSHRNDQGRNGLSDAHQKNGNKYGETEIEVFHGGNGRKCGGMFGKRCTCFS